MTNVRTGRRYRANRVADHYDAIVIGSGIGGLTTAALLSLMGKKVCVLEQHYTAGGFTHAFERNGYEWDVGVHYIGEVHKPSSSIGHLFNVISQGRLKWAAMDPVYDRIILGEKEYDLVAGRGNFISKLSEYFPAEKSIIRDYVTLIRQMSRQTPKFFAGQAMPRWMAKIYNKLRPWLLPKPFFQTTRDVLEGMTDNQELISALTGQWGDYGQVPAESAFLMHALIAKHYLAGGAYPVGGAAAIARAIIPTIQQSGGDVLTYAEVKELLIEKNGACGVLMANGDTIKADVVVSNTGYFNSMNKILPTAYRKKFGVQQWNKQVHRSSAHLCVYAGFSGTAKELDINTTNLWIYPDGDHEGNVQRFLDDQNNDFPLIYVSFPSAKDPDWDRRYPGKSTVEIVTVTNVDWFEQWQDSSWQQHGDDYQAKKDKLQHQLLEVLFDRMPQLREALDYAELSTPLSTQYFQHNERGEIYGLNHFNDRFEKDFLHPQTPLKNFYLTGVDVMTAGVGGGLMGGVMTAMCMNGLRGNKKVMDLLERYRFDEN